MNIISIVSCRFWLTFERFLLFNVRSQMYNNWITKIFILLVTSTWHSPWNGWHVFLSFLSSKILFKEDTLFTYTKSDNPPAPDCLLQMTIFHLQIRWLLLHSATNHILYIKQRPPLIIFNFRTIISVFMCTRRGKSKSRSMNANFITTMQQFQYFLRCCWPNKKQEAKLKTCPTLITLTIKYQVAKAQIWVPFDQ